MHAIELVILGLVVIIAASLTQVYAALPLIELKRRARSNDALAKAVYKVSAYRVSSQIILWLIAGACAGIFFVLVSKTAPVWLSLTACAALVWVAVAWVPRSGANSISQAIAKLIAPAYAKLLHYLQPLFRRFDVRPIAEKPKHTQVFEKEDILRLFAQQAAQTDNRISGVELDMLKHMLIFNDKKVADVMVGRDKVVAVKADDRLGPVVLDELHKTGLDYFPVYELKKTTVIGILNLNSVDDKKSELVRTVMTKPVHYLNEDQTLAEALAAFIKTNQSLFLVVNGAEDYIGIITLKQLLSELAGPFVADEFDQYDNRTAVAHRLEIDDVVSSEDQQAELVE